MLGNILDFLFGKAPDIFDADGNVVHKFKAEKWKSWNDRFSNNGEYDWRKHKGTERKVKPNPPAAKS